MPDFYFNEESDYSEVNTWGNDVFYSTILQPFQFESEQKKKCVVIKAMRKKLSIFMFQLPIYYILEAFMAIWPTISHTC